MDDMLHPSGRPSGYAPGMEARMHWLTRRVSNVLDSYAIAIVFGAVCFSVGLIMGVAVLLIAVPVEIR